MASRDLCGILWLNYGTQGSLGRPYELAILTLHRTGHIILACATQHLGHSNSETPVSEIGFAVEVSLSPTAKVRVKHPAKSTVLYHQLLRPL